MQTNGKMTEEELIKAVEGFLGAPMPASMLQGDQEQKQGEGGDGKDDDSTVGDDEGTAPPSLPPSFPSPYPVPAAEAHRPHWFLWQTRLMRRARRSAWARARPPALPPTPARPTRTARPVTPRRLRPTSRPTWRATRARQAQASARQVRTATCDTGLLPPLRESL